MAKPASWASNRLSVPPELSSAVPNDAVASNEFQLSAAPHGQLPPPFNAHASANGPVPPRVHEQYTANYDQSPADFD